MATDRTTRAARHAALSDAVRLAIIDELTLSDRAPVELRRRTGVDSNLLAHHLDVLETAGLIGRSRSSGDGRRRYVHLLPESLQDLVPSRHLNRDEALFVCSRNSARSQLAAALWRTLTGSAADSAGTHPADRVHPGAIAAAHRAGLELPSATPKVLDESMMPSLVVTVCDQAHETLGDREGWLHWSIADPLPSGSKAAFDKVVRDVTERIEGATGGSAR